ncbi:Glycosyl transferase family 2 [Sanguibacter gelidistatuariae]|uniref:Glycosyl transferase family 2 n=1 Tax=Sanguibacter gelidistatuariae TaxID=1814289 RepID=A0A1G6XUZ3_9MICO|nr:glycosyltransferase family 2 protein [Sanguibacter gelidistatuariae]SDD82008.1 Glycosyl transferase family 2 [Sanguibacter gelidistatuariae]
MTPRVSVVVPSYNNVDFIAETMRSILAQTFTEFELVVADHSSTDGTWEALEEFRGDSRVRLVRTPAGGGAPANWNRVSRLATGDFVKLVCGDDLIHPTMLERQLAAVEALGERGADIVLVASQRDLVDARGKVFVRGRGLGRLSGVVDGQKALRATVRSGGNLFGEPACVLIRRSALEAVGWWQDLGYYLDVGSYARVIVHGDIIALREPLASFRVSAQQWSVRLLRQQAREAADFHASARDLAPSAISGADVRLGNVRAKILALQRRVAYALLGDRMRPASST